MSESFVRCKCCGESSRLDDCDVIGACEGNAFCGVCSSEIDADDGQPALLCGSCQCCKELKENDEFDDIQTRRQLRRSETFVNWVFTSPENMDEESDID
jgi:hypothetical protein